MKGRPSGLLDAAAEVGETATAKGSAHAGFDAIVLAFYDALGDLKGVVVKDYFLTLGDRWAQSLKLQEILDDGTEVAPGEQSQVRVATRNLSDFVNGTCLASQTSLRDT